MYCIVALIKFRTPNSVWCSNHYKCIWPGCVVHKLMDATSVDFSLIHAVNWEGIVYHFLKVHM